MFLPLLDSEQANRMSQGQPAVAKVVLKYDNCTPSPQLPLQGMRLPDTNVDDIVRASFKENNILLPEEIKLIHQQVEPTPFALNLVYLFLAVALGAIAIVSFFQAQEGAEGSRVVEHAAAAIVVGGVPCPEGQR